MNRTIVRVLDAKLQAGEIERVDRVLLQEDPQRPSVPCARGEQRLARMHKSRFVWHCWRMIRKRRPDLVFFDHIGLSRMILAPLPSLPPKRYAVFIHGREISDAHDERRFRALDGSWRLLVNSEVTREIVRERFPHLADRVRLTRLCVDPARVAAWSALGDREVRREPAALIVGRMWTEERGKGHGHLIEAWPRVLAVVPEARLWIAGEGNDRARLEAMAAQRGIAHAVEFLGRISDEELHVRYQRASLLAMPSRQEGFGLVYAEAMWHGLPCLGSRADAARCVIDHGETGWLVAYGDVPDIADAVIRTLSDPTLVARMGEAGRRVVAQRFSYAQFESALLDALDLASAER